MFKLILLAAFAAALQVGAENTKFFLYSRDNPQDPVEIFPTIESIVQNNSLFRLKTAIVVHGHGESGATGPNPAIKDAFLESEDVAVIVVDWSESARLSYLGAVNAVPSVGESLAELVKLFDTYNRLALDRLHLVGFDLGAHIVGFTGRHLNGDVARITGLDPNGSQWGRNSGRLRETDAKYVEVIHTDGSGLIANGIGTAIGNADFFPNGGSYQPGCLVHSCSHKRAWEFFAASLNFDHFIARHCSSNLILNLNLCSGAIFRMGNNDLTKFGSGIFRVNTGNTYPF